jgi:ATP-binding cassette subfamily B protein
MMTLTAQPTAPKHPLLRLLQHTRQHRRGVFWASTYSILNKIFDLAPPFLIGAAVDIVVAQENSYIGWLGFPNLTTQLWILAGLTLLIWGFESLFEYAFSILWRNLAQTIQHELRLEAYSHVQGLEIAYFEDRSTGGLLSILNDDINQLERFLDIGANELLQLVTTVLVIGGAFFWFIPSVAWLAVLPMPFVAWGAIYFQKAIAPRYAAVREQVSLLNAQLANNLSGIATIKSFTAENYETEAIRRGSDAYRDSNRRAIALSSAFVPLIRMIIVMGFVAILVFGGQLAISGSLNIGVYSVLVFMTQRLLWPLTRLGQTMDLYQRAMASTARVLDLLDTEPQIIEGQQPLPVETVRGEITVENVTFEYGITNGQMAVQHPPATLRNLTLHIPAGETAAIVGSTGSGKSTLVKLLLRLYDVQVGQICLDGWDVRELRLVDLRQAIGFVSQDVFLFHGTVRDNIRYGSFEADMVQVIEAARTAEAHEFITKLPHGYDTIVGERGQKLSGGQRQRLSIARAILKDPPILILDEATSAVDNETEAAIQRSLERIAIGRTTIVIAHRLSTVRNADRIFVLEQGVLREQGRHEELIEANGIYASLWRVQTGERLK